MIDQEYKNKIKLIYEKAKSAIGKKMVDIVGDEEKFITENKKNKGSIGLLIEKYLFDIPANTSKEADFLNYYGVDIELKVIPLKYIDNKRKLTPKERMSMSMINFDNIKNETFEMSSFYKKNKYMLIMTYIHDFEEERMNYVINSAQLYNMNEDMFFQNIKKDWEKIKEASQKNITHLITEKDYQWLSPARKGNSNDKSYIDLETGLETKRRVFSFKQQMLKRILETNSNDNFQNFLDSLDKQHFTQKLIDDQDIFDYLDGIKGTKLLQLSAAKNWHELAFKNFVRSNNKNMFDSIYKHPYLKISHKISDKDKIQEEINTNINLNPLDIINEVFDKSVLYNEVLIKKYIILIIDKNTHIFRDYITFYFNEDNMKKAELAFNIVKQNIFRMIENKEVVKKLSFNLKKSDNLAIHVRPHAKNNEITYKVKGKELDIVISQWWINKDIIY
ncbi:hypothetical protein SCHIN_v1c07690 [Spiroplasma chinense]|uniref:DNA mismatch repair MutH/Type II restriction enzyme Sau3AI domain-containing protein n=1 Tax=Spiroplasma chinense TaxID=216932 RepID=A0A5B9Y4F7_9MOLU|nr:MutH/Sau3AI family endonuclease [Spiroplasma chinense]QEH61964.1 hypothetical protein SCHIN_v1c07690 [Spiroplasma chinense]